MSASNCNCTVSNTPCNPLYVKNTTSLTNPIVTISQASQAAMQGQFFTITTGSQSVTTMNNVLVVQMTIPANSNKTVYIQRVSGGATANTVIDILYNATFAAAGTSQTPVNTNQGSSKTSVVSAKFTTGTDPTTGGTLVNSIIQTGGPVVIDYDGRLIIPSTTTDRTFYVRLINTSGGTNSLSVNISYWEI